MHANVINIHKQIYKNWVELKLSDKERERIELFENKFRKESSNSTTVVVFHLIPGRIMIFHSSSILHSTIVPLGTDTNSRKIFIFHKISQTK